MGNCNSNSFGPCFTSQYYGIPEPPEETDTRKFVVSNLQNFLIFSALSIEDEISLSEISFMPGDDIVIQGDSNIDTLYLLRSGKASVLLNENKKEIILNVLTKGAIIGERAFLCQGARTATVRAMEQCSVVGITRLSLEKALGFDSIDMDAIDATTLQTEVLNRLEGIPLLQPLVGTSFIKKLANEMKLERYLPGDEIIRVGDVGEKFYFIDRGSISVVADFACDAQILFQQSV